MDEDATEVKPRWWGSDTVLLDDDEARRRLVAAAMRCMVRRGSARVPIDEVAEEARVSRSTVYRYFRNREDLVRGVMLSRVDVAMDLLVGALTEPGDAAASLPALMLSSLDLARDDAVTAALFSDDSRPLVVRLETTSEPMVDGVQRHLGPLLEHWRNTGQIHADLDVRETVRWMISVSMLLFEPPWSERSLDELRTFVDRYVVRAMLAS